MSEGEKSRASLRGAAAPGFVGVPTQRTLQSQSTFMAALVLPFSAWTSRFTALRDLHQVDWTSKAALVLLLSACSSLFMALCDRRHMCNMES